jgi:hypothetical protein
MSHSNQNEAQNHDDGLDPFEQQLRSFQPMQSTRSWNSTSDSIEASLARPASVDHQNPTASAWRPLISHAVTAAIGLAIGAATILMLQPRQPASQPTASTFDPNPKSVDRNDDPTLDKSKQIPRTKNQVSAHDTAEHPYTKRQQPDNHSRIQPIRRTISLSLPLRVFGVTNDLTQRLRTGRGIGHGEQFARPRESEGEDSQIEQSEDAQRPRLSPRSLHLFFDELTSCPTTDSIYQSEDFQS